MPKSRRLAFVFGSNGPLDYGPLKFAKQDATSVAHTLSSPACGFEVQMPPPNSSASEVNAQLLNFTDSANEEDTILCYFSGHGILRGGKLFLLWDDTVISRWFSTSIHAANIMAGLDYSRASNKLLILDCCNAGGAIDSSGFKSEVNLPVEETDVRPDNHLALMASDRFEQAREIDRLDGSFMTVNLCRALNVDKEQVDTDEDGRISITELTRWLQEKAASFNRQFPDEQVPVPHLFGRQEGQFFLTQDNPGPPLPEFELNDGTTALVLPVLSPSGAAVCIGKHPVTNSQYRRFVKKSHASAPAGQRFDGRQWAGPYKPWSDSSFNDPSQPVVCVCLSDALAYCEWVTGKGSYEVRLPTTAEWELAAVGPNGSIRQRKTWLGSVGALRQQAFQPARVDESGASSNPFGFSGMFGNVWEWCTNDEDWHGAHLGLIFADFSPQRPTVVELRGGSFLDDLRVVDPYIDVRLLTDGPQTRHSDLGFRLAAEVPLVNLPRDIAEALLDSNRVNRSLFRDLRPWPVRYVPTGGGDAAASCTTRACGSPRPARRCGRCPSSPTSPSTSRQAGRPRSPARAVRARPRWPWCCCGSSTPRRGGERRGTDITTLAADDVRRVIGLCAQDAHIFDSTIEWNLRLARPAASEAELRDALRRARLLDWVDSLPAGLRTPVGEHGARLSGGQRQRLALARVLADLPVMILDEPGKHLDEPTAAALMADLLTATDGRTRIVITHRPAFADQVLSLGAAGTVVSSTVVSKGVPPM